MLNKRQIQIFRIFAWKIVEQIEKSIVTTNNNNTDNTSNNKWKCKVNIKAIEVRKSGTDARLRFEQSKRGPFSVTKVNV